MVPGSTAFAGIFQVQPGHVVKVQRQGGLLRTSGHKYWDLDFPKADERDPAISEEEHIKAIRSSLLEAIEMRLVADVPVGCYLSGGIDSCSILGLAAAVNQSPIKAFTIGFDDSRYDETDIAKEMAEATDAEQDVMRLSGDDLYDHFETTLWHTERTIYNTLGVAKYLMSRHVRHVNYKVVLTGEGSDELFAGYPAFRRDMFLHGQDHLSNGDQEQSQKRLDQANALVTGAMLAAKPVEDPHLTAAVGFTPSCLQPWLACAPLVPSLLSKDRREAMQGYEPGKAIAAALDRTQMEERHVLDRAQYVWIKTMLEGQILTWGGDRVDMANSMEARPPFLDHHLAAVAVQVPPELRIKDQREKHVLREAVAGLLPERLYHREKFAFMAPPAHADDDKLQKLDQLVQAHLSQEAIEACGLLDPEGVQELLKRHRSAETPAHERVQLDAMVNHLLGVQILHKLFVQTDVPAQAQQAADARGWHVREPAQVF
jgi:asparagine synthase (glutamine-hydrolysing)